MVVNKQEVEIKKISHWRHDNWPSGYHGGYWVGGGDWVYEDHYLVDKRSVFLLTNPYRRHYNPAFSIFLLQNLIIFTFK